MRVKPDGPTRPANSVVVQFRLHYGQSRLQAGAPAITRIAGLRDETLDRARISSTVGSSRVGPSIVKTKQPNRLVVRSKTPPTVEIDTETSAAYVRFKQAKVAWTVRHDTKWPIVTFDLDARGKVVGIEFVGVKKFNLGYLLQRLPLKASPRTIARTSYVSAEVHSAAA